MRKILIVAVAIISVVACKKVPDYAIISGKANDSIAGQVISLVLDGEKVKDVAVKEDGTFLDTIRGVQDKHYYMMLVGREPLDLYLQKGTNIAIDLQASPVQITGVDAEASNYLLERNKYFDENVNAKIQELFVKEPTDFKLFITTMTQVLNDKLAAVKYNNASFVEDQKKWITYTGLQFFTFYPDYYRQLTGKNVALPVDFAPENKIGFDDAQEYEKQSAYKELVMAHYSRAFNINPESTDQVNELLATLRNIKSENIRQDIAQFTLGLIGSHKNVHAIYEFAKETLKNEELLEEVERRYNVAAKLTAGAPSPIFSYPNQEGKMVSLTDFRGKYVYIDVWATWCAPCRSEIVPAKVLEEKFKGKKIVFVGVSIDDPINKERWQNFIKEYNLAGVQVLAENAWNSSFITEYGIRSIPRFILLDTEGNIIMADAPRPSDPQTLPLLTSLVQ